MNYGTFGALRKTVTESGSNWFSPDTMRWFGTGFPTDPKLWGGRVFIARHQAPGDSGNWDETVTIWAVHYVSRSESGRLVISEPHGMPDGAPRDRLTAEKIAEFVGRLDIPEVETYESGKNIEKLVATFREGAGI